MTLLASFVFTFIVFHSSWAEAVLALRGELPDFPVGEGSDQFGYLYIPGHQNTMHFVLIDWDGCSNTNMVNFRFKNDSLAGLVNWGDVINDIKAGDDMDPDSQAADLKLVREALKKQVIAFGGAFLDGMKATFDKQTLSLPGPPAKGQVEDYNAFSKYSAGDMYQMLFAYGWNKEYSYSLKGAPDIPTPPGSDPSPIAMAVATFVYIGQVMTAFLIYVSDASLTISWHQAAIVWASMQAMRNLYDTVMNTLKVARKLKFPIKMPTKGSGIDRALQTIQSGAVGSGGAHGLGVGNQPGDYNFETWGVLLNLTKASAGVDGEPPAELLCDAPADARVAQNAEQNTNTTNSKTSKVGQSMEANSDGTAITFGPGNNR